MNTNTDRHTRSSWTLATVQEITLCSTIKLSINYWKTISIVLYTIRVYRPTRASILKAACPGKNCVKCIYTHAIFTLYIMLGLSSGYAGLRLVPKVTWSYKQFQRTSLSNKHIAPPSRASNHRFSTNQKPPLSSVPEKRWERNNTWHEGILLHVLNNKPPSHRETFNAAI